MTSRAEPSLADRVRARADDLQRRHAVLGFPYAVVRKYSDDEGGRHAALMTYYGFLSLIPIMLLVVVVISQALSQNPERRLQFLEAVVPEAMRTTVDQALAQMPSTGVPLVVGLVGLIGSGLGVVFTATDTVNHVAAVPHRLRATGAARYVRGLLMLVVLIVGILAIGSLTSLAAGVMGDSPAAGVGEAAASVLVLFLLLTIGASLLLPQRPRLRSVWFAALLGSLVISAFLALGARILPPLIERAGPVYGTFATLIGLFAFISIVCQAIVYSAEVAVVRQRGLWPRSLDPARPTSADEASLTLLAREQERVPGQIVTSSIELGAPSAD